MQAVDNSSNLVVPSNSSTSVKPAETKDAAATDGTGDSSGSSFASFLQSIMGASGKNEVSEEELFAGVVEARLKELKGDEAATKFHAALDTKMASGIGPHGYFSFEDGAKEVLTEMTGDGTLTDVESNSIYSESFAAAQLDDKTDALFDSMGGADDITISTATLEQAIQAATTNFSSTIGGKSTGEQRLLSEASTGWSYKTGGAGSAGLGGAVGIGSGTVSATNTPDGTTFDGSGEFLFKPVSNNEGTLAIILPQALLGRVTSVDLKDPAGTILETGHFTSAGDNGTNEKYSFSKEGGEYPQDLTVSVTLNDGSVVTYSIPDPSQRYD